MRRWATATVLAAGFGLAPAGAWSQTRQSGQAFDPSELRFRLSLDGAASFAKLTFDESRAFTEFAEEGRLDAGYSAKTAAGVDLGIQFNITRWLGVGASFALTNRDSHASYTAALPHPLYLNQPRRKTGDVDRLGYKETVFHYDLVYSGWAGPVGVHVFGGASFFRVDADLLAGLQYTQTYPYDSAQVTVTDVPSVPLRDNPIGFNAGAGLDYRIGAHVGIGAQARFSRARVSFVPATDAKVDLDAGGFQLAVGARLYF